MSPLPGDQARVSVLVAVEPDDAFRVFTEDLDQWWRRGIAYRAGGKHRSVLRLEPRVGGRLTETIEAPSGTRVVELGRVIAWEPPARLAFEWRAVNFVSGEKTEVEVRFEPSPSGTRVTVTHRGWSAIRPDHPARHGLEIEAFVRMLGMWWGALLTSLRERAAPR